MTLAKLVDNVEGAVFLEFSKTALRYAQAAEALEDVSSWSRTEMAGCGSSMVLANNDPGRPWCPGASEEAKAAAVVSEVECATAPPTLAMMEELKKERVPEVGVSWDDPSRYQLCFAIVWKHNGHNNIGEMRMVVSAVRHACRDKNNAGRRVMVVTDSLVSLGGVARGRSSSVPLCRLLRKLAACTLLLGVKVYCSFIGTKRNAADGPSRGLPIGPAPESVVAKMRKEGMGAALSGSAKRVRKHFGMLKGRSGG